MKSAVDIIRYGCCVACVILTGGRSDGRSRTEQRHGERQIAMSAES